jgi:hypothetical protein
MSRSWLSLTQRTLLLYLYHPLLITLSAYKMPTLKPLKIWGHVWREDYQNCWWRTNILNDNSPHTSKTLSSQWFGTSSTDHGNLELLESCKTSPRGPPGTFLAFILSSSTDNTQVEKSCSNLVCNSIDKKRNNEGWHKLTVLSFSYYTLTESL